MEDEISRFSEYFVDRKEAVQEAVLDLHDEAFHQLTELARSLGIHGSNEFERSVALQYCLDLFFKHATRARETISSELHFLAGEYKPRTMCLLSNTLKMLGALERDLRCTETILIESAIRFGVINQLAIRFPQTENEELATPASVG